MDLIIPNFDYPNGLAFSPDESVLYVANTRPGQYLMAYDVHPDGKRIVIVGAPDEAGSAPTNKAVIYFNLFDELRQAVPARR